MSMTTEELTRKIRLELAQEYNWDKQQKHWESLQDHNITMQDHNKSMQKHWLTQERHWTMTVRLAVLAIVFSPFLTEWAKHYFN